MAKLYKVLIAIILLLMPVIWVWFTQSRENQPPTPPPAKNTEAKKTEPTRTAAVNVAKITAPIPTSDKKITREAVIETGKGNIVIGLYEKDAKITTKNFIGLVQKKFYDGLIFHRVEPGLVIQTGDPTGTGSGGSDKTIPLEIAPALNYNHEGMLGMARTDDPNSASSQFFINLQPYPAWNKNYAIFGKVLQGMDVVNNIAKGDKMKSIYLLPGAPKYASPPT